MGDNFSYMIIEEQVIKLYDANLLTLPILDILCESYRGTDIDSGGSQDLSSKDEKTFEEICMELISPNFVEEDNWSLYEEFSELTSSRWGWR